MGTMLQDVRFALRMLLKSPGFTAVAVLTLALGIGANSAIFSVVNGVVLKPLPFVDPDRLAMVFESNLAKGWDRFSVSPANFADWRDQTRAFTRMAAFRMSSFTLTGGDDPEVIDGALVSADLFSLLGAVPLHGRTFLAEEDQPGKSHVVVITHGLWQSRFGTDRDLVGSTLTLNGEPYTVVGIMPPGFRFTPAALYTPIAFTAEELARRGSHYNNVVGRLAPGVSIQQAQSEMETIASGLRQQYPDTNTGWGVVIDDLREVAVGDVRPALLALTGAVGFVLLIACANVANLLLARAAERRKEIAIRTALGAGRARLVRQLLTESLLLAGLGGGLGLLIALWGTDLLVRVSPGSIPRSSEIHIDGPVLGFTLGVSLLTGLVFGLLPAIQISRSNLHETLKEGGRTSDAASRHLARNVLVVSEVALALVLLICAGLMIKSFRRVVSVDPGFNSAGLLTMELALPRSKYAEPGKQRAFLDQALDRIEALPGVESAAAVTTAPLSGNDLIYSFQMDGMPTPSSGENPSANYYAVSHDYFRTMSIPLRKGRLFTARDTGSSARVAIVDETFVRRFAPDQDPIGKMFAIGNNSSVKREIVGIVGSVNQYALESGANAAMYEPLEQQPSRFVALMVRGGANPSPLAPSVRGAVSAVDNQQAVFAVKTMEQVISESIAPRRLTVFLLSIFAALALALAAVGLYGVISYSVTQRTHEMGIRMALGARGEDVMKLVLGQGMTLTMTGVVIGLVGALAATRLLASLLFSVSATDPLVFGGIAGLQAGVAFMASYLPARRATKVDPMVALRCE